MKATFSGVMIGLLFPLVAFFLRNNTHFLFGMICTAPLVLALCSYLVYRMRNQTEDLIAQKKTELVLASQKNLLETILNHLPSMVFAKDYKNEMRFILFNTAGEELLGVKSNEVIGKNDYDLFPKEQADFFTEKDKVVFKTKQTLFINQEVIDTPKGQRTLKTVKVPTFLKDGNPDLLIGISVDITDELELLRSLDLERSRSIHHSKLASLGEMSAGVAHEINNPLAIISGNIPLLIKFRDDPEKFNLKIKSIEKSVERIAKIVLGLKKFARVSDSQNLKPESLGEIIRESIALTEANAKRQNTRVEVDIRADAKILCDSVEIEQVFVNIINNAIDAAKNGSDPWIQINAFHDQSEMVVQVIDSGEGISIEVEARLFEPFFTTKAVGEGTGLGLSISKGILAQHQASIILNRNLKHTCFEIRFQRL